MCDTARRILVIRLHPRQPGSSAVGGGWSRMGGPLAYASSSPRDLTILDRNSASSWRQTRHPVSDGPTGWSQDHDLHRGCLHELIADEGEHREGVIVNDNPG